ncbi:hypothetical protein D9757_002049 [Collybiopsis confluens]|uniref:Conserved oligomeric Golgi complex subunit 3 n=1 Tax=Collybiopsis confluens TaxID=2823264 RepID=A0A8H5HY67_9AGAR|nr:hypothetical protein D9757_002049 [Collybiopsis confluens]
MTGSFSSHFAQFTSQPQPIQQQPQVRQIPSRASPLARSSNPSAGVLTAEEWEAKAPLDDLEIKNIASIKRAAEHIEIPDKASSERDSPSRPSTPHARTNKAISVTPGTPGSSRPGTPSRLGPVGHKLHPKHALHTPQQFYDWHALISRSVTHAQESHFRAHLESVSSRIETCDLLISHLDLVHSQLSSMHSQWQGVEDSGRSLKESSQGLLIERDALLNLENELGKRLDYFKELDYATRMLNAPVLEGKSGQPLVMESEFLDMVERVVICIQWLEGHRHYREAEIFLLRFRQCLTRAMTLIKMYFVGSLRAVQGDVGRKLADKAVASSVQTIHHLLYTRFRALTSPSINYADTTSTNVPSSLRPLLLELEYRARSYPSEIAALLGECHAAYFTTRKALVGPVVRAEIEGLVKGIDLASGSGNTPAGDVVELTRTGCSYLKQLCADELDLFRDFFTTGEDVLYNYLEILCDYLYDDLRPRILHEPRLTALCEVCTVLQALMALDVDVGDDGEDEIDPMNSDGALGELELDLNLDSSLRPSYSNAGTSTPRLHISQLLRMILQDAQTRLFFKAQAVVQSDIRHYVAKEADFAYPVLRDRPNEKENFSLLWSQQPEKRIIDGVSLENQDTWFPTLRKTIWVLEQLHDFVNPAIFEDIAEEAIVLCQSSLAVASDHIMNSPSTLSNRAPTASDSAGAPLSSDLIAKNTLLDGYLFLVRHLLILREVPARFGLGVEGSDTLGNSNVGSKSSFNGFQKATSGSVTGKLPLFDVAHLVDKIAYSDTLASLFGGGSAASLLATFGVIPVDNGELAIGGGKRTIGNAKRLINQSLRLACENTIATGTNDVCEPLRMWVERVGAFSAASAFSKGEIRASSSAATPPSMPTTVATIDVKGVPDWGGGPELQAGMRREIGFDGAESTALFGGLEIPDEDPKANADEIFPDETNRSVSSVKASARTLSNVLIQHIQERIAEEYAWFRDVIWGISTDAVASDKNAHLYSEAQIRELRELRETLLDHSTLKATLIGISARGKMFTYSIAAAALAIILPLNSLAHLHGNARSNHHGLAKRASSSVDVFKRDTFSGSRWTFFATGLGSCGTVNVASDFTVALNSAASAQHNQYDSGNYCYKMITMQYNGKTTTAQVTDRCPGCPWGGLDLTEGLFTFFADESAGVLSGSWWFNDDSGGGQVSSSSWTPSSTWIPPSSTWTPPSTTWSSTSTTPSSTWSSSSSSTWSSSSSSLSSSSSPSSSSSSSWSSSLPGSSSSSAAAASATTGNLNNIEQVVLNFAAIAVEGTA